MENKLQILCHHCKSINRVPENRLADGPRCGHCHSLLFCGDCPELESSGLAKYLRHSSVPVLVLFWAGWCGYCQKMRPVFQNAARTLEPGAALVQVNTETSPELGSRYTINSLPTLVAFKNGREIARQAGAMSQHQLLAWVRAKL